MAVGAELTTLFALHRTFNQMAEQATDIKTQVNRDLGAAVWTGAFADRFNADWAEYSVSLDNLRSALEAAALDVKTNHNNIAAATGEGDRI